MLETDIALEIRSEPRLLCPVRHLVRTYFADFGFPEERCHEVMLAVDEACTNALRHAYEGRQNETLVLSLRSNEQWTEIEVRDEGRPAPPEKTCRKPPARPDPGSLHPGGLGVQLIYEVFDEVTFAPGEQWGNCVSMRLKRPRQQA